MAITDTAGTIKVQYEYDAWGEVLSVTGELASTLGQQNPMRYRGYYLDNETGYYYLQSRYYDTNWKRFLNADDTVRVSLISPHQSNIYLYCQNKCVNYADPTGEIVVVDDAIITTVLFICIVYLAALCITQTTYTKKNLSISGLKDWAKKRGLSLSNEKNSTIKEAIQSSKSISNAIARTNDVVSRNRRRDKRYFAVQRAAGYLITLHSMTKAKAKTRLISGKDVLTYWSSDAKSVANACSASGSVCHKAHGSSGYYSHYHVYRSGGRNGHSFYISKG